MLPLADSPRGVRPHRLCVSDDKGKKENVTILIRTQKSTPSDGKSGNPLILGGRPRSEIDRFRCRPTGSLRFRCSRMLRRKPSTVKGPGRRDYRHDEGEAVPTRRCRRSRTAATAVRLPSWCAEPGQSLIPLRGVVRTMTYRIDGRRDSAGGDMVWKNKRAGRRCRRLGRVVRNVRSIRIISDAAVQGKIPLLRRG